MMYLTRASLVRANGIRHGRSCRRSELPGLQHRLIWSLFPSGGDRDFLFRETGRDVFLILSARVPEENPQFQLETVEFTLQLNPGDRLAFSLRCNATRTVRSGSDRASRRGTRTDIVMHEMSNAPLPAPSAERRMATARVVGPGWLCEQGRNNGFAVSREDVVVQRYHVLRAKRRRGPAAVWGVLDLTGVLSVTDPDRFSEALAKGFGRAKAFGCGLMLVGRAQ